MVKKTILSMCIALANSEIVDTIRNNRQFYPAGDKYYKDPFESMGPDMDKMFKESKS